MKTILNKAAALWRDLNKTQLLRHGVQILSFLLFPGLFLTVFNALRDVVVALCTGAFSFSALSGSIVTLIVVLGVTALWGRFFCGYLCTFGALQELLALAGKKLLPGRRRMPEKVDKLFKYVKYGILLAVVLLVWAMQLPVDSTLSPWGVFGALLPGNLSVMADNLPTLGFGLLLGVLVLSLFVERAFCRYFCPLGALFTPLSSGRLFRIRRLETACTGCQACTRSCAMGVAVHEDSFVRSGECIDCMKCLAACRPEALRTAPAPAVAGTASALALCGLIQVGRITVPEQPTAALSLAGDYAAGQVVSAESSSPAARYADGVYTGTGSGFRGVISAQVTVENGRITDVTILSSQDDSDFFQRAQASVIPAILQSQSVNVSAVSGATYSSRGILEAVANALQLDASALPEITDSHGRGKGSRSGGGTTGENGTFSLTPPSGENGRERKGQRSGQGQTEGSQKGQRSGQGQTEGSQKGQRPGQNQGQGFEKGQRSGQGQTEGSQKGQRSGRDTQSQRQGKGRNETNQGSSEQDKTAAPRLEIQAPATVEGPAQVPASADRTYQDGVYTGSGIGYRGATEVQVTVENGQITDITVLSYTDDRQYFSRAQSSLISAILNAQGVDVSTVSGATFSSNGILEAVADALDIDFTNPNSTMSRGKGRH